MQSYQRFQHIVHTVFNTSGTNAPRSLSRLKVDTHSALLKESHTTAHTAKQRPSGRGCYHYPRHVLHVHEHPRAGCQNGVLCRFGILAGRCSRRTQKAFGTAMRLCVSLSRGVAAPLGCVIFLLLSKLWLVHPALRAFCACEAWVVSLPSDCFTRFGNPAWPGVRTANFAALESWSETLLKNAESLRSSDALMRVAVPKASRPRWAA